MSGSHEKFREWDREQWAGGDRQRDAVEAAEGGPADPGPEARWTKSEWVGEDAQGRRPALESEEEMPEGDVGLSGNRHNPGVQHWVAGDTTKRSQPK
ncbi:MAG TPA: hypothetical protein VFQ75_13850 [Candidatus Limnocylindrales bacterium]|nr:hypothetical protein [Candidatus Limnocylindrales bacterium]